MLVMR